MTILVSLVERTPFRLRYLCIQDGNIGPNPATIPNNGGASPDLLTDALAGVQGGENSPGLLQIIAARTRGIGPIAAGTPLTQAQARAVLNSDDAARAVLTNANVPRAVCRVIPRAFLTVTWAVDVDVDGQGDPVVLVRSFGVVNPEAGQQAIAYVDIHMRHTPYL